MNDKGKQILLISNATTQVDNMKSELEKLGYRTIVAITGNDAVEKAQDSGIIDLLLIDTDPGAVIDVIETAELILKEHDLPILFLTAHADAETIRKTETVPACGYVSKSADDALLDAAIRTALRLHRSKPKPAENNQNLDNSNLELQQTINTLQTKLMFLDAVANSAYDGILVVDARGNKVLQNRRTEEMWKIPQEIIDDPDGMKQVQHVMHMTKNPEQFMTEIKYQREHPDEITKDELLLTDGRVFERYSSPVYGENRQHYGRIYTFHDITKRIQYENTIESLLKEKDLLLKEVHHRIKNNMNTVMTLLNLQAASIEEQAGISALNDAANRITSMMVLYDQLYKSMSYEEISTKDYLDDLIDKVIELFPRTIDLQVEKKICETRLKVNKLQALGIIVNELLTNIMKYAFKGKQNGTITITLFVRETDKAGKRNLCLTIHDDGNGIPESVTFENTKGFGLMLVNTLTKQLNGRCRIERDKGSGIVIEFPG